MDIREVPAALGDPVRLAGQTRYDSHELRSALGHVQE